MNAEPDATRYSREQAGPKIEISGPYVERSEEVLTPLALQLLASLHRRFNSRRLELLAARQIRQADLDAGWLPDFVHGPPALTAVGSTAGANRQIEPVPADLRDRRVEITGPVDRKMIINALNAPVKAFMADFDGLCSPTWGNIVGGQVNLRDAIRGTISFSDRQTGKDLSPRRAALPH